MSTTQIVIEESNPQQTVSPHSLGHRTRRARRQSRLRPVALSRPPRDGSFASHPDGLTIAEISHAIALSRAAVRRLLITLELLGYIEAHARKYQLRRSVPGETEDLTRVGLVSLHPSYQG